ncbi:thioredoxin domain-containing protein [Larkinella humicola]|uniref:Thioredoxin domain-containing protein n=1 Tax=Larkinella humicola TaxID=2607654 RepID=A0A5N1JKX7_9BACT|nr:thioredoxin domain-containing protein [Larkinella humicola]KAA9356771.1 thioredoxin domain-containing protein [Larkinella humicola]
MNRLAQESSPYLLQHAHNPVDWFPWGPEALQKAQQENKPILVSIGYSACHWCHVMERESFENESVASVMNDNFVCIKVDREERPDVDAIYMDAVQAMGVQGGWPLNVFLMPDAKPFYGLTYLPARQWMNLLTSVRSAFAEHPDQLAESAEGFAKQLNMSVTEQYYLTDAAPAFTRELLEAMYQKLAGSFDSVKGGPRRAPKFPMPSIYGFLLRYYHVTKNEEAQNHIRRTLDFMALGGIYDQIGGGFSRYSVDDQWFAPHFEKMLYDNGQLVTLYSEAYSLTQSPLYRQTVFQTIAFLQRELTSPEGGFYSALDADSEGVEGKFYTWTTAELQAILEDDFNWFSELYHIAPDGNWEEHAGVGRNILHRVVLDEDFARRQGWTKEELADKLSAAHQKLMVVRDRRIRPGLDDKMLCSWNGLMLKGLVTAYRVFGEVSFLDLAERNARFILEKLTRPETGQLWHSYKSGVRDQEGVATITAYLEDYAAVIDGFLALYQATFKDEYLLEADRLARYTLDYFWDEEDHLFFFTDQAGEPLIARKKEVFDNVIPASNSMMAHNLYTLSLLLEKPVDGAPAYTDLLTAMLGRVQPLLQQNADYLTHWAALYAMRVQPTAELAIVGPDAEQFRREIDQRFYPNKILAGTLTESDLPLLVNRTTVNGKTAIYVCYNRSCQLPVTSVEAAFSILENE